MRLARFIPLAFISIVAAAAEPRAAAPAAPQPLTTVTYDFSELILPNRADDQPDPTPKALSADMPIGSTSITRSESREKLVSLVQETIDPRSWRADGGP